MIKGLYVITTEVAGRTHIEVAQKALGAGAKIIQYREKNKLFEDMVSDCFIIKDFCRKYDSQFLLNDFIDLAFAVDSDGIHLGQGDSALKEAHEKLEGKIIGISVSKPHEALQAESNEADYLGVGPIFPTPTKTDAPPAIGIQGLRGIRKITRLPLIAIGGINISNAKEVYEAGADGIAVISAIALADDIEKATKELIRVSEPFTKR